MMSTGRRLMLLPVALLIGVQLLETLIGTLQYSSQFDNELALSPHALPVSRHFEEKNSIFRTNIPTTVYCIANVQGGGSLKYINDLKKHYSSVGVRFIDLPTKRSIRKYSDIMKENDILLFQHLLFTDFTFDSILALVREYGLRLVIPIHDLYFLTDKVDTISSGDWVHTGNLTFTGEMPHGKHRELLEMAEALIFPSFHIYEKFRQHLSLDNMHVVPHIDFLAPYKECMIPVQDNVVNIGIITSLSVYKGARLLEHLIRVVNEKINQQSIRKNINNSFCFNNITFHIYSDINDSTVQTLPNVIVHSHSYNEGEIFDMVIDDQIHGLVMLNEFSETYSYALTKGFETGLPILYSDMGAVGERVKQRFIPTNKPSIYVGTNNDDIYEKFLEILQLICAAKYREQVPCANLPAEKRPHVVPRFYDKLIFGDYSLTERNMKDLQNQHQEDYSIIHKSLIEPYAVYFPQFHAIAENDYNFHLGYTDMTNLMNAKQIDSSLLTPDMRALGYYNLEKDREIIPRQIDMAKSYGFAGFAVYYYWFSVNSITNNHTVFTSVIDRFFEEPLDFSVFFMFCNEGWTSNVAFQSRNFKYEIQNYYDERSFEENLKHLIPYFKHENYRKIDNKPLLFLHHPYLMTDSEILLFREVGNRITRANGFDGIIIALNNDDRDPKPGKFNHYALHPQYKSARAQHFISTEKRIDYNYYVRRYIHSRRNNTDTIDRVNSAFTNFDNSVRFFTHENSESYITKTSHNGVHLFKKFLQAQFMLYLGGKKGHNAVSRIFLVNSWNEWGEQMALEPSQEMGYTYLQTFQQTMLATFANPSESSTLINENRKYEEDVMSNPELQAVVSGPVDERKGGDWKKECDEGYLKLHRDVAETAKKSLQRVQYPGYKHWKYYGKNEGRVPYCEEWLDSAESLDRVYYPSKDACDDGYIKMYPDLVKEFEGIPAGEYPGLKQWELNGRYEGRIPYCEEWYDLQEEELNEKMPT